MQEIPTGEGGCWRWDKLLQNVTSAARQLVCGVAGSEGASHTNWPYNSQIKCFIVPPNSLPQRPKIWAGANVQRTINM